ncbi:MAG: SIMPL domain-containing protein [Propionibacteriaceae bacterium]
MSESDRPTSPSAPPLITVRGEAQLEAQPDLATFSITALRTGDSQEAVRDALATASAQVRELLDGHLAAIEKSSTTGLHVTPVFGRRQTKVQGYRGSFTTEVVVHDFDALSTLVFALAPIGDSQLDGPYWSLRPDNPVHRQVRLAAIADARSRADDYALAFAARVADLVEVSDLDGGFSGGRAMRAGTFAMAKGADEVPEFEFEPSVQSVSGQVTVRFTMTAPDVSAT